MLMLDRYLVTGSRALDLATGASVHWRTHRSRATPVVPLFAARGRSWLIDFDLRGSQRIEIWERPTAGSFSTSDSDALVQAFRAALAEARDGRPRALDLVDPATPSWPRTQRLLAREARLAGFVPLAAEAFGAALSQARWRWPSWLRDRALVVFATDGRLTRDATLALFKLATKDARPHLVVRCATAERWPSLTSTPIHVHESPPGEVWDTPASLRERSTALGAAGQNVDAEAAARWSLLLSSTEADRAAARCALADSLIALRRPLEARAALAALASPEAESRRTQLQHSTLASRPTLPIVDAFLDVLRTCQEVDDAAVALARVAFRLQDSLAASTVAFVIRDRERPLAVAHSGPVVPSAADLSLALQVLDTGLTVPLVERGHGWEAAWGVHYGATVVGALWCRWAAGIAVLPQDLSGVLGLSATATAPALHELSEQHRTPPACAAHVPELVGESEAMIKVRHAVVRAAASPFPVLVEGESGAGKELVARAIHLASARRARRLCALNCAALADDLVEAELFGHTRGAFTGAVAERLGLFEEAHGGTLFLDEVAELSARVQAKLLRTLQEGEVRRIGESSNRKVDTRIVAATNRPLATEVAAGRFRNDLRYRLDVLRISVPPLRERLEDIPLLVRHTWATLAARTGSRAVLSPAVLALLGSYDWPGNVRELQNVLASVMVAGPQRGVIGAHSLPAHIARTSALTTRITLAQARREFEARYVRAALARAGGRTAIAAGELGVSRQGLRKLTERLGLERAKRPGESPVE